MTLLADVLALAAKGWAVVPLHSPTPTGCSCRRHDCASPAKHPRLQHGLKDASKDPAKITEWWGMWPDANVAVVTGSVSGLVVLDVDGDQGEASLEALVDKHVELPETLEVLTGRGRHLYFSSSGAVVPNSASKLGPGLDVRGEGGYVVGPPSIHMSGRRYAFEVSSPETPAPLPSWLSALLMAPTVATKASTVDPAEPIAEGGRNAALTSLAGRLRRAGLSAQAIEAALAVTNSERCRPPLADSEIATIATSIARYEAGKSKAEVLRTVALSALRSIPDADAAETRIRDWARQHAPELSLSQVDQILDQAADVVGAEALL